MNTDYRDEDYMSASLANDVNGGLVVKGVSPQWWLFHGQWSGGELCRDCGDFGPAVGLRRGAENAAYLPVLGPRSVSEWGETLKAAYAEHAANVMAYGRLVYVS